MSKASMHPEYDRELADLAEGSGVGRETLGQVLAHVMRAYDPIPRSRIAADLGLSQATVSKAVRALLTAGFLEADAARADGPGRPIVPLRLGTGKWALIGVKVGHRLGAPAVLTGIATTLNGQTALARGQRILDLADSSQDALVDGINDLVTRLIADSGSNRTGGRGARRVLGLGVEFGGPVHADRVIYSTNKNWADFPLGQRLSRALRLPTVIENDVNALALHEMWKQRYTESDLAIVAVFDEGVGCGLILDGKIYRGGHGLAGELGHLTVEFASTPASSHHPPALPTGFDDPCPCEGWGHVDALATPSRIRAELNAASLDAAASITTSDKRAVEVFRRAGRALGRGISALITLDNPSRVLVLLPPALATPVAGGSGAEYVSAAKRAISEGRFSIAVAGADLDQLTAWEPLDEEGAATEGATAAAIRVLDHFLEHTTASGRDGRVVA